MKKPGEINRRAFYLVLKVYGSLILLHPNEVFGFVTE